MTNSFMLFLALFVALGLSIGRAFAGGVAFGKCQDNEASSGAPTLASAGNIGGNFGQQSSGGASQGFGTGGGLQENLTQLRQRFQSGDVSPEDLAQLREQFQSGNFNSESLAQLREQFGSGDASPEDLAQIRQQFGGRFGGGFGGGVTGTVDRVEGNLVTVETADGPKTVTIGQDTGIQKSTTGTIEDLQKGVRIAAFASPDGEEGAEARLVVLIPEGAESPFGDGLFFGGRQGQDGSADEDHEGFGERRFQRDGRLTP